MKTLPLVSFISLFLLSACGKRDVSTATPEPADSLEAWFSATPPSDPQAIHVVRENAKPGDAVTLSGLVMGREKPFVEGRAAFVLGDPQILKHCAEIPGDACETPWDVCCESAENKLAGTATIQLVDEEGRVLRQSLKGAGGLTELSLVTLTGTVAESSTPEALVINASTLHVTR